MATLLQQAIDLAKAGNRNAAETLLRRVLANQPDNEIAWMWLSGVTRDAQVKQEALQRALKVNPANALAQQGLAHFGGTRESPPPSAEPPAPIGDADIAPPFNFGSEAAPPSPSAATGGSPQSQTDALFDFGLDEAPSIYDETERPETPTPDFDFEFEEAPALTDQPVEADTSDLLALDEPTPFGYDSESVQPKSPPAAETKTGTEALFDFGGEEIPANKPELDPIFDGFNLDEPPIFDIDIGLPDGATADSDTSDDAPFNWDEPLAFSFDGESINKPAPVPALMADEPPPGDELPIDSDSLEELFAIQDDPVIESKVADEEPPFLTDPKAVDNAVVLKEEEDLTVDKARALARRRRKKQTRLMIVVTGLFALLIVSCSGLFYYLFKVADTYTLIPQLAGLALTEKAGRPNDAGEAIIKFRGYTAARAKIEWTSDPGAETCSGTTGLEVDFMNGDPPSLLNNSRFCAGETCSFEKDITPSAITDVSVTYKCGKNATITLFQEN